MTNWQEIATTLYEGLRSFTAYDGMGKGGAEDGNRGDWQTAQRAMMSYEWALRTMEVPKPHVQTLADDLADVLAHMVVGWEDKLGVDLAQHPEVQRVMARYRESKNVIDPVEVERVRTEQKPRIGDKPPHPMNPGLF